jgi:hypothetical protein
LDIFVDPLIIDSNQEVKGEQISSRPPRRPPQTSTTPPSTTFRNHSDTPLATSTLQIRSNNKERTGAVLVSVVQHSAPRLQCISTHVHRHQPSRSHRTRRWWGGSNNLSDLLQQHAVLPTATRPTGLLTPYASQLLRARAVGFAVLRAGDARVAWIVFADEQHR